MNRKLETVPLNGFFGDRRSIPRSVRVAVIVFAVVEVVVLAAACWFGFG